MSRLFKVFLLATIVAVSAWADTSEVRHLEADLSPSAENPPVSGSEAVGTAHVDMYLTRNDAGDIISAVVDFDLEFYLGQEEEFIALHIHSAAAGSNGPIVISSGGLDFSTPPVAATAGNGRVWRQRVATSDAAAMEAIEGVIADPAGYYVNLHSSSNRPGLLRGKLRHSNATMLMSLRGAVDTVAGQINRMVRRMGLTP